MNRIQILESAAKLIDGDRKEAYGDIKEAYSRLAEVWTVLLENAITPTQVLLCLCAMKLLRAEHRGAPDDFIDLAGYAALAGELAT